MFTLLLFTLATAAPPSTTNTEPVARDDTSSEPDAKEEAETKKEEVNRDKEEDEAKEEEAKEEEVKEDEVKEDEAKEEEVKEDEVKEDQASAAPSQDSESFHLLSDTMDPPEFELMVGKLSARSTWELGAEIQNYVNTSYGFSKFSNRDGHAAVGGRLGYRITNNAVLVASYHHYSRVALVIADNSSAKTSYLTDQLQLGAKLEFAQYRGVRMYGAAYAVGLRSNARFDPFPDLERPESRITNVATHFGGQPMIGVNAFTNMNPAKAGLGWHLEAGYTLLTRSSYDDWGTMQPGGPAVRSGLSLLF